MSSVPLSYGKFDNIGDEFILQLLPLANVSSITSFVDSTSNVISGQREFTKDFRYSINGGVSYTSWATLSNAALAAISFVTTNSYVFQIRYVRSGSEVNGSLRWKSFSFDNIVVLPCFVVTISKGVYDNLYGTAKYLEISNAISKFNPWALSEHSIYVFLVDDSNIISQDIYITLGSGCVDIDINDLFKTDFGRKFIRMFDDIDINLYSKRRTNTSSSNWILVTGFWDDYKNWLDGASWVD